MKKRIIPLLLVLMLLIIAAFSTHAAEVDPVELGQQVAADAAAITFPTDGTAGSAACPICGGASVFWTALTADDFSSSGKTLDGHYYLSEDIPEAAGAIGAPGSGLKGCLHLNGKKFTSAATAAVSGSSGVLNIMGTGEVKGGLAGAEYGATVVINTSNTNGAINLYGGTYSKVNSETTDNVVGIRANGGIVSLYSGATITSGTGGSAVYLNGEMNYTSALFNMYGGTIDASASNEVAIDMETADTLKSTSGSTAGRDVVIAFNMHDGTLTGGTGTNGGSVIVRKNGVINISGGTVTGGNATKGGNIYVEAEGKLNMTGGTVTEGTAAEGGNIFADGGDVSLKNATVSEGEATDRGGNLCVLRMELSIEDGTQILNGTAAGRAGSIRAYQCTINMTGGTIKGGTSGTGGTHNIWLAATESRPAVMYMLGGTIDCADNQNNTAIAYGDYCTLYMGGDATVTDTNATYAGIQAYGSSKLYVCDGWSGSADIYFAKNYTCGTAIPDTVAQVVTLDADRNVTAGGAYTGKLIQRNTTVADICGTAGGSLVVTGTVVVDAEGNETTTTDPLVAWSTGEYAYIKLYSAAAFEDLNSSTVCVDLNGYDLTVGGTGTLQVFDSANDAYSAAACGTVTNNGTVKITDDLEAPNGNRYIAVTNDAQTSAHRLDMRITAVSLRTSVAGLYYKAVYNCDTVLEALVKSYGVVLSVNNMPGADFLSEEEQVDVNCYTTAAMPFESGVTASSGSVFGIMKDTRTAELNAQYGEMSIYANPYICFDTEQPRTVVGDNKNADKTVQDDGFVGVAHSLHNVLDLIDKDYYSYTQSVRDRVDQFYQDWKEKGMAWSFVNIGADAMGIDNSDLVFDEGTTDAVCPVCREKVTWTALTSEKMISLPDGSHYYLNEDLTHTGTDTTFVYAPGKRGQEACLHLNGHNITATATKAIYGSGGVLNVMGNGVVSGYNKSTNRGAAVQINNSNTGATVNLYGGTYTKGSSPSYSSVVSIWNVGGTINIYEGATIENTKGASVHVDIAYLSDAKMGFYGGTVTGGTVSLAGARERYGNNSYFEMTGGTIGGTLEIAENNQVTISGAPVINKLSLAENVLLKTQGLEEGASIGISAVGCFTEPTIHAQAYKDYFIPASAYYQVIIRDEQLYYGKDYASNLKFTEGTTAVCPACEKEVEWTAIVNETPVTIGSGEHYYLADDAVWSGDSTSFIGGPSGGKTGCLHLNGYDLTAEAASAIYGSGGILNVMGTGTVTGHTANEAQGAAVQINTSGTKGTVNLYSGTFEQSSATGAESYTVSIRSNGGIVNIYDDAVVKASTSGNAVRLAEANLVNAVVGVYGGTVEGDIYLTGVNTANGNASELTIERGVIRGTVDANGVNTITLIGAPKIQLLDVEYPGKLTLERLTDGADITVRAFGRFTQAHESAEQYLRYFQPVNRSSTITVADAELVYHTDYAANLKLTGTTAYCPVCEKDVTWTPLSGDKNIRFNDGDHYYLAADVTYTGTEGDGFVSAPSTAGHAACLHLNGHNMTATATKAIFGGSGVLNVMGSGVVTGYTATANHGAAVQINNTNPVSAINLYSGTYAKSSTSVAGASVVAIWNNGGAINLHEGATIRGGAGNGIYVGKANLRNADLSIYGATVEGGVYLVGASDSGKVSSMLMVDGKITGTLNAAVNNAVTLKGRPVIKKMVPAEGLLISLGELLEGTSVGVSAEGTFTQASDNAEIYLQYFSTADEGEWVVVRDHALHQQAVLDGTASDSDIAQLDSLYEGREPYHGEMHDHADTGGTSDGHYTLEEWKAEMERIKMDFATIVDHKQSLHMRLPEWDNSIFIGGSEAATWIQGKDLVGNGVHYNMIFSDPAKLDELVTEFTEYNFTGGDEGHFSYPHFTAERLTEVATAVREKGGLFVNVHPKYDNYLISDDPLDYYFGDETCIEIQTGDGGDMGFQDNEEAYQLWVDLLELGKRVWASVGSDKHALPNTSALTTIYSSAQDAATYLGYMREGDFVAGPVGIRMSIGQTTMGGKGSFEGNRVIFSVGDFHECAYDATHSYRVELYDDRGVIFTQTIADPSVTNYFAVDADTTSEFYRVVLWDDTKGVRIAVGNPIWSE